MVLACIALFLLAVLACGDVIQNVDTGTCFRPLQGCGDCEVDGVVYTFREYEFQGGVSS